MTAPPPRAMADRAAKVRFRRALSLMAMTLLLPGSAQLIAGNRTVGRWAVRIALTLAGLGVLLLVAALLWHDVAFWFGTTLSVLTWFRLLLIGLAIGWAALFVDAWRLGRPLELRMHHRRWLVAGTGVLTVSIVATLLFGAHLVGVHRGMIQAMFTGSESADASAGRYNVLLIGSDSGKSRWGMRPDSVMVASIDASTGKTVLIGLPRNLQNFPFAPGSTMDKEFPDGFDCDDCYLNSVSTWAGDHAELFGGDSEKAHTDAVVSAVEGITDLDISYWAMVNLQGFKDMVDAVGGVTINVRDRLPVGLPQDDFYTHLEPGVQKLNGFELLWYARSRHSSDDYSRMARQKCVVNATLKQISPATIVSSYQDLAKAGTENIKTSIPPSEIDDFAKLALKAKDQKMSTVSLVPPMIDTGDPDIDLIHGEIEKAIEKSEGGGQVGDGQNGGGKKKSGGGSGGGSSAPIDESETTGGSIGSLSEGYAANRTDDLGSAC